MNKKVSFLIISATFLSLASVAFADPLINPLGGGDFTTIICRIVIYISGLVVGLAVLMFVWAGILFMTSAGNEGRYGTAKKVLMYAMIGAAIALAGSGLIQLVAAIIGANGGGGCEA